MKRISCLLVIVMVALLLTGGLALADGEATLYADFSCGNPDSEPQTLAMAYEGELDAFKLAQGLSDWSGLDFKIAAAEPREDGIAIDWAEDSTLLMGLDDREQKDEFFFFDVDSMDWFMMDSLLRTIQQNLGCENVYYTMQGGKNLLVPNMSPPIEFPADLPFMSSPFFYAHEGGRGEDFEAEAADSK